MKLRLQLNMNMRYLILVLISFGNPPTVSNINMNFARPVLRQAGMDLMSECHTTSVEIVYLFNMIVRYCGSGKAFLLQKIFLILNVNISNRLNTIFLHT